MNNFYPRILTVLSNRPSSDLHIGTSMISHSTSTKTFNIRTKSSVSRQKSEQGEKAIRILAPKIDETRILKKKQNDRVGEEDWVSTRSLEFRETTWAASIVFMHTLVDTATSWIRSLLFTLGYQQHATQHQPIAISRLLILSLSPSTMDPDLVSCSQSVFVARSKASKQPSYRPGWSPFSLSCNKSDLPIDI